MIYDISSDNIRNEVSETCKNFGLSRIQKSAFMGILPPGRRKELAARLRKVLGESEGNIQIFVICDADLALREVIGREYVEGGEEVVIV
ncbi:CRISPR-associated endoribonuclease Cas2 [Candidatus Calditenuaceae archaeon HR02]|nr:CRISPR-associated endoribonuclease Cas2 [Candidatus Calditenuaceae archaeon HR02]